MIKRYLCQTKEEIDYIFEKYSNDDFPTREVIDKHFYETNNVSFFFDDNFNFESWCNLKCELYGCSSTCEMRFNDFIIVRNWVREKKLERLLDE